jgi:hypothetical protein
LDLASGETPGGEKKTNAARRTLQRNSPTKAEKQRDGSHAASNTAMMRQRPRPQPSEGCIEGARPQPSCGQRTKRRGGRTARQDDAVALFNFFFRHNNIIPNVFSYISLILAHYEAGWVEQALNAYQDMLDGVTSFSSSEAAGGETAKEAERKGRAAA